ncbi:MAG: carboxypeptidase-like regulatory domain-containing protein, partial [Pedobacter sp.]
MYTDAIHPIKIFYMKKIQQVLVVLLSLVFSVPVLGSTMAEIKGRVNDAVTGEAIPGATIYISDLKSVTTTNEKGEFVFRNIPGKGKFLVEARFIGYKTTSKQIDLSSPADLIFSLQPSVIESAEVVITGTPFSSNNKTNSLAVITVGSLHKEHVKSKQESCLLCLVHFEKNYNLNDLSLS